jgi:hypothetical protein
MWLNLKSMQDPERRSMRRVAIISHALFPGHQSSSIIGKTLKELGRHWPLEGEDPGFCRWVGFPVAALEGSGGADVWVDFYVIPVFAPDFAPAVVNDDAYLWTCKAATHAISGAALDNVPIWIGWGGMVRNATKHGARFVYDQSRWLKNSAVYTTHGSAGTVALVMNALKELGIGEDSRIAIIGASGALGSSIAYEIQWVTKPAELVLVGRPDEKGVDVKFKRLFFLKRDLYRIFGEGKTRIEIRQDKAIACLARGVDTVIIATSGAGLLPEDFPPSTRVLDLTIPSVMWRGQGWGHCRKIFSGCGCFEDEKSLPRGFLMADGSQINTVGASGDPKADIRSLWGCTGHVIGSAMFDQRIQESGKRVSHESVLATLDWFDRMRFRPRVAVKEEGEEEMLQFISGSEAG